MVISLNVDKKKKIWSDHMLGVLPVVTLFVLSRNEKKKLTKANELTLSCEHSRQIVVNILFTKNYFRHN